MILTGNPRQRRRVWVGVALSDHGERGPPHVRDLVPELPQSRRLGEDPASETLVGLGRELRGPPPPPFGGPGYDVAGDLVRGWFKIRGGPGSLGSGKARQAEVKKLHRQFVADCVLYIRITPLDWKDFAAELNRLDLNFPCSCLMRGLCLGRRLCLCGTLRIDVVDRAWLCVRVCLRTTCGRGRLFC